MISDLPKVMHKLAGKPLIDHVLDTVASLKIENRLTIVGHGRDSVSEHINSKSNIVVQEEQLGTGHAIMQAIPHIDDEMDVIILSGDQPLLSEKTLKGLISHHQKTKAAATVLTAFMSNPFGYGRILKDGTTFTGIIEERDADAVQKEIKEINTGTYCFNGKALKGALASIAPKNAQGEYYLTDVFGVLLASGAAVEIFCLEDYTEALGINNRVQLAEAEDILYDRIRKDWMARGVTIVNPSSVFIDPDVELSKDVIIHPFSIIKGKTKIEENAEIGPSTTLLDCYCAKGCKIEHSVARNAVIGEDCIVGPFAYLRPGAVLGKAVKVGDFVEIKNSTIGDSSKVPHLSYVGDSVIGREVNIGAGTITCNYDGKNKYQTIIQDNAFIGSNTNLVAPVNIGKKTVIGAGSTITRDVPDNSLSVERAQQKIIENWQKAKDK